MKKRENPFTKAARAKKVPEKKIKIQLDLEQLEKDLKDINNGEENSNITFQKIDFTATKWTTCTDADEIAELLSNRDCVIEQVIWKGVPTGKGRCLPDCKVNMLREKRNQFFSIGDRDTKIKIQYICTHLRRHHGSTVRRGHSEDIRSHFALKSTGAKKQKVSDKFKKDLLRANARVITQCH